MIDSHNRTVLSWLAVASSRPSGRTPLPDAVGVAGEELADGGTNGRVPESHHVVVAAGGQQGGRQHLRHAIRPATRLIWTPYIGLNNV